MILVTLSVLYVAQLVLAWWATLGIDKPMAAPFVATPNASILSQPFQDFTGCYLIIPNGSFAVWVPELGFQSLLCILMLYKAFKLSLKSGGDPLLNLIIRDRCVF